MKKFKRSHSINFFGLRLIIISLIWLTACQTEALSDTPIQDIQPTIISTISKTPTTIVNNEENATSTMAPTFTISAITPTQTPRIPPTLLPEEVTIADLKMLELYETNGNCRLPCWWGFMPGETKWTEAKSFLSILTNHVSTSEIVSESNPIYFGEVYLFSGGTNYYRQQIYTIRDDIIEKINVEVGSSIAYPNYTLAKILSSYGVPSEIWISSYGHDNFGEVPFTVVLFFKEDAMLLKYDTNANLTESDGVLNVKGCIQDKSVSSMALWKSGINLTFLEAVNETAGMNPSEGYLYRPLQEVTDMTIASFYQTFLDPDTNVCIETPAEIWVNDH